VTVGVPLVIAHRLVDALAGTSDSYADWAQKRKRRMQEATKSALMTMQGKDLETRERPVGHPYKTHNQYYDKSGDACRSIPDSLLAACRIPALMSLGPY
jgi:hypothetical protein